MTMTYVCHHYNIINISSILFHHIYILYWALPNWLSAPVCHAGARGFIPKLWYSDVNPLTAVAVHIRFFHFISAHYISVFKPVKDKKRH